MTKWNAIMGDGCNLPRDCVTCDIIECGGRTSEIPELSTEEKAKISAEIDAFLSSKETNQEKP